MDASCRKKNKEEEEEEGFEGERVYRPFSQKPELRNRCGNGVPINC